MARKGETRAPSQDPVILHVGISFCNYRYDKRKQARCVTSLAVQPILWQIPQLELERRTVI